MKPQLLFVLLLSLLTGCTQPSNQNDLREIKEQLAALGDSISDLKDSLRTQKADTVTQPKDTRPSVATSTVVPVKPVKEKEKKTPAPVKTAKDTDPVYHYYVNEKISVKFDGWKDYERKVHFYDLYGKETYTMTEIRKSYTESVDLKFAPNGSVSKAVLHINPGASLYWYETEITFSTTNDPISKIDHRYPQRLDDMMNEKWQYWNPRTGQWEQQQIME